MITPEAFVRDIERYLDENEICIENITCDNIDYDNNEKLFWGNDIFDFFYGATRGCFVPAYPSHTPSFVMKFDFDGLWEKYCETEVQFYKDAVKEGLEKCFARITKFDKIGGTWLYKAEYVDEPYRYDGTLLSKEECDEIKSYTEERCRTSVDVIWANQFIQYYGKDIYGKFLNFIASHGINDLNLSNIGYKKGRPIVLDYAGYFESMS